jgi:Na+/H+-dicarboxylate symporter
MKLQLHWKIFIGLCLGFLFGFLSRVFNFQAFVTDNVSVIGSVFLRALRMIIIPLIVSSIISSVSGMGSAERFGRLSLKALVYYIFTSLLAIITGLMMVNLIKPGVGAKLGLQSVPAELPEAAEKIGDMLIGIIPTNPFASMAKGEIFPTIFFSLLFGFFITRASEPYREQLKNFFKGVFEVMMLFTQFIIKFTPIGVFALVADITARSGLSVFAPLGSYMLTVALGLSIHAVITLPVLIFLMGKVKPFAHFRAVSGALMTAFSTASSAATLPLTIDSVRKNVGVSNNVSGFVLPLGATVNMDGTALYECVAAIFIAQVYGIELSFLQQAVVVLTALLASIGAAAVPMAGLVMIVVILRAVGLPLEGVGLILAVDRILDMMRTSVNVWSDTCGSVIIARTEGEKDLKV